MVSLLRPQWFNGAETWILWEAKITTTVVDVLVPCFIRTSAVIVLNNDFNHLPQINTTESDKMQNLVWFSSKEFTIWSIDLMALKQDYPQRIPMLLMPWLHAFPGHGIDYVRYISRSLSPWGPISTTGTKSEWRKSLKMQISFLIF